MKSEKPVVKLENIVIPLKVKSERDIDFSLNNNFWKLRKGVENTLTYLQFEVLNHSGYAQELFGKHE